MTIEYKNIARVVRSHGTKGEVIVAALRGLPFLLHDGMTVALTPPVLDRDRFCRVRRVVDRGQDMLVAFEGVNSLHDADDIVGCTVLARADDLALGALDAAVDDLLGREVVDERFGVLGTIREVMLTPAHDVWVVDGGTWGEVLIPVIEQVVEKIPDSGAICVRVMDGLIDIDR